MAAPELFRFDNTYARELAGCYAPVTPATVPAPELLRLNDALAAELGLDVAALDPALARGGVRRQRRARGRDADRAGVRRTPVRRLHARSSATGARCSSAR